jgi:hypothetical protein
MIRRHWEVQEHEEPVVGGRAGKWRKDWSKKHGGSFSARKPVPKKRPIERESSKLDTWKPLQVFLSI